MQALLYGNCDYADIVSPKNRRLASFFKKNSPLILEFRGSPLVPNDAPLFKDAEFKITWKKVVYSQGIASEIGRYQVVDRSSSSSSMQ